MPTSRALHPAVYSWIECAAAILMTSAKGLLLSSLGSGALLSFKKRWTSSTVLAATAPAFGDPSAILRRPFVVCSVVLFIF
jgi:hypothetical protein